MKKRLLPFIFAILIMFSGHGAIAAPAAVGDVLPTPFTLKTEEGDTVDYKAIQGTRGAVLVFTRSLEWCPFCILQAKDWNANSAAFVKAGYHVATVSYDSPAALTSAKEKLKLDLPLYSDTNSAMIKSLGILNEEVSADNKRMYGIPNPTIYVVNEKGIITHRFAEKGYQVRPDIMQVKKALNIE